MKLISLFIISILAEEKVVLKKEKAKMGEECKKNKDCKGTETEGLFE